MEPLVVVHPPVSVARDFIDYPQVSNLAAVQLTGSLRAQGFDPNLVDAFALNGSTLRWRSDGRGHLGASVDEVLERTPRSGTAVVIYSPFHRPPHRDDIVASLLQGLRERGVERIVLSDAYQSGQHYVESEGVLRAYPEADAWLKYEAERSLPGLLRGFEPGVHVGERPDMATLALPAWDAIDRDAYWRFHRRFVAELGRTRGAFPLGPRTLPLLTSRGCPFTCIHCSSNPDSKNGTNAAVPKVQRRLPIAHMRKLLRALQAWGADTLYVLDELINVRADHFDAFLAEVAALDLRFEVPNGFRADYLKPRHFARMRGRVTTVSVSAESGSPRVVADVVNKKLDLAHIRRVAGAAEKASVPLLVHYMIGLPGERPEEINETLELALELWDAHRAFPAVQFATPLPGTELAARSGALPVVDDWGPYFQKAPTTGDPELLERFMHTFQQRFRESQGPQKLIMNVTYVCNNHCTFCAVGTRTQVDGHPTRQREILDKYRRHGITMVDFDGGEPTLNPELIGLIRHAKRIGYERLNVTTNGRLCAYEDFAEKLVKSGLTTLLFSVHGPDMKSHAREVGVAEAFDQTLAGIRYCMKHRPESLDVGMNITLTKTNFRKLDAVAQLAWDEGLRWLNIQFLTPFGRATTRHAPDTDEAAAVAMKVIDDWRDRMKIQVINLPWCFMPGYEEFLVGDAQKLTRHMVFVNNEAVNLAEYLAERRKKKPQCAPCPHACFCSGFYEMDDVPEPEWIVSPESLLKKTGANLDAR